ncbi:tonalli isoform b [Anaeramoeba flamelloides]|uniref:Tonalli isoform b n=1 Tax=Anaeramoeba flamelloides TaxID=1746091 RepID=A0AAV8A5R2_9EUKA|nr:tonalli isoform b [Anaeramoeba flamelloides]
MFQNKRRKNYFEESLNCKINKLKDPIKRSLFTKLKTHYHQNKKVSYQTITQILFGDSLLLMPKYPPLVGPGIVNNKKSLRFVVPKERIDKIKGNFDNKNSKFCLRFLSNPGTRKGKGNEDHNNKILVNINKVSFQLTMDKPFQIDLSLFNQETNELTFVAQSAIEDTVIVLQNMYQIEISNIVNIVKSKKRVNSNLYSQDMEKLIFSSSNTKNEIISFKCPLSKKRISVPARGLKCKHLQCFDLGAFIRHAEMTKKWICPCCSQPITLRDLVVDGFIEKILTKPLQSSPEKAQIKNPQLYHNGEWQHILTHNIQNFEKLNLSFRKNFSNLQQRKRIFQKTTQFTFKRPLKVTTGNKTRKTNQTSLNPSFKK